MGQNGDNLPQRAKRATGLACVLSVHTCLRRAVTARFRSRFSRFGERRSPTCPRFSHCQAQSSITQRATRGAVSAGAEMASLLQPSLNIKALQRDSRGQSQERWVKQNTPDLS